MTLRLLAVHAHPDDESSKGAATYAAYRARGAEVMVVSCTGGERGSVLNAEVGRRAMAERDIAGLRRLEMAEAQAAMGIQHRWLGYADSGLPENGEALPANCFALAPLEFSASPLVAVLREYRPQVVVTYDENGGYPHPDHIRTHEVTMRAIDAAADASAYPGAGAPWAVQKLYYERIFNAPRMLAVHAALSARDPEHPRLARLAELAEWMSDRPDSATTRVPIGDFLEARDAALRAHASQVAPDDEFFFWPNDLQREAWPFEDYELVRSTVPSAQPEDDLFAGIEDEKGLMSVFSQAIVWLADPTPSLPPASTVPDDLVTPGVIGFIITFLVAVAAVLLIIDMTRRVRRLRYREEIRAKLEAEQLEAEKPAKKPTS